VRARVQGVAPVVGDGEAGGARDHRQPGEAAVAGNEVVLVVPLQRFPYHGAGLFTEGDDLVEVVRLSAPSQKFENLHSCFLDAHYYGMALHSAPLFARRLSVGLVFSARFGGAEHSALSQNRLYINIK
jgi:hypothetical protein